MVNRTGFEPLVKEDMYDEKTGLLKEKYLTVDHLGLRSGCFIVVKKGKRIYWHKETAKEIRAEIPDAVDIEIYRIKKTLLQLKHLQSCDYKLTKREIDDLSTYDQFINQLRKEKYETDKFMMKSLLGSITDSL